MLKFAVVREDFEVEAALVQATGARACLTVASGGCTALALKHRFPGLEVHAFDLNPDQLAHARRKADAIAAGELRALNVGDDGPSGLSQRGEFEKLFRVLRRAWLELVMGPEALEQFFVEPAQRHRLLGQWTASPYWPACFEVAFAEGLLHAMFGPDATRHAPRGSYPAYFQRAFERGLSQSGAAQNPFLQHVLLQRYLTPPAFLTCGARLEVTWHQASLTDVPALERFEVVSLSNIFDWSDEALVAAWARALRVLSPGSLVVYRQLNNQRDWRPRFEGFVEDVALSDGWTRRERALFYERVTVLRRV
jgi:S-adenosylmethionine-diacylglycerol 3-amino-3-carboxypropyl transferase